MGQEILYCCRCQTQLRGHEFERGKAFRFDAQACCLECAPEMLKSLPNEKVQVLLKQMAAASAPQPAQKSEAQRLQFPAANAAAGMKPPPSFRARSPVGTIVFVSAALAVALVILWLARGHDSPQKEPAQEIPRTAQEKRQESVAPRPTPAEGTTTRIVATAESLTRARF